MNDSSNNPKILIVEDDPDQMNLLIEFVMGEIRKMALDQQLSDQLRPLLKRIQIIKVDNVASLQRAASKYQGVILSLLDGNIPDANGQVPNDQLVKTNHRITGQHRSVDIISQGFPNTPITIISSFNRFKKIVVNYYDTQHDLSINFISKRDTEKTKKNIAYYLRQYLRTQS